MIEIRVVSKEGRGPVEPRVARFGESGGDIGRGPSCTLVLEDSGRRISRRQATVTCRARRFFVTHLGGGLATEIGGHALAIGAERELFDGDEIRIGPYVLRVVFDFTATRQSSGSDPFAPFAPNSAKPGPNAFAGIFDTPSHPPRPAAPAPSSARDPDTRSVEFDIGDPTSAQARLQRSAPGASTAPAIAVDAGVAAFLAGAGIGESVQANLTPQHMELVGRLFREALQGTLDLLAARTIAKRELHADGTMLKSRDNNPLKFSPSVEVAFAHLLGPTPHGFMPPVPALRDAFDDLRAHQIAVLAGMRAALSAVVKRFDPVELEVRLTKRSTWDALVPAARKAKLWDVFAESFSEIHRETEDDFEALFGRAFLEAYSAQLAQISRPPGEPKP